MLGLGLGSRVLDYNVYLTTLSGTKHCSGD